jgi:hypothetical protein
MPNPVHNRRLASETGWGQGRAKILLAESQRTRAFTLGDYLGKDVVRPRTGSKKACIQIGAGEGRPGGIVRVGPHSGRFDSTCIGA